MISSGVDLIDYNEGIESFLFKPFFKEPWKHNKWVVMGLEPDSDSVNAAKFWLENTDMLETYYDIVHQNQYYQVFKLK